jgi:hypothetical protein
MSSLRLSPGSRCAVVSGSVRKTKANLVSAEQNAVSIRLKLSVCSCLVNRNHKMQAQITKCRHKSQNAGTNHKIKIGNESLKSVTNFKYFVTTNQNSIQEEIKSRLKSGNACYLCEQNLLSSSLLSKNIKIKIYRTIILPVVLYGCETWSQTLRVEHDHTTIVLAASQHRCMVNTISCMYSNCLLMMNCYSSRNMSASSIGTTTLSWVSACSTVVEHSQQEDFTEYRCQRHVQLPTWRRTRNLERSNFRHKRPPSEKWPREFCRKWRLPRHFWGLLHAIKHDMGQTVLLPLRRKACWGFFCPKNPTASAGLEPANLGTKGQHATSRPPKPLFETCTG